MIHSFVIDTYVILSHKIATSMLDYHINAHHAMQMVLGIRMSEPPVKPRKKKPGDPQMPLTVPRGTMVKWMLMWQESGNRNQKLGVRNQNQERGGEPEYTPPSHDMSGG
jgi:hypothetical protein